MSISELINLTMDADSLLSYLHHRGYIAYGKDGAPLANEVETLIGKLRKVSADWLEKGGHDEPV